MTVFPLVCFLSALAEKFVDIVFLVDNGLSPPEFQNVKINLIKLVSQLNVGASAHRIGLAQYATNTSVAFYLNGFQTKKQTVDAVRLFRKRPMKPKEPRNLGKALQYANTNLFTKERGSRADQGYRQYLVVLSGKDSDDSVYKESRQIKAEGVTVVGMSLGASMSEMGVISTASYAYDSISNLVPGLKALFERQDQEANVTGGEWLKFFKSIT